MIQLLFFRLVPLSVPRLLAPPPEQIPRPSYYLHEGGGGGRGEKGTSINIYSAAIPPDHYPPKEGVGRDNPASNPPLPSDPSFARKI